MANKRVADTAIYTVRIPVYLQKRFDEICAHQDKSRNQAIIECMAEFVQVQGDYISTRNHFRLSMEWMIEEKLGRMERLNRQYLVLIINMLTILVNTVVGRPVPIIRESLGDLKEIDKKLHPLLKSRADELAPPKPERHVPQKPQLPKQ